MWRAMLEFTLNTKEATAPQKRKQAAGTIHHSTSYRIHSPLNNPSVSEKAVPVDVGAPMLAITTSNKGSMMPHNQKLGTGAPEFFTPSSW